MFAATWQRTNPRSAVSQGGDLNLDVECNQSASRLVNKIAGLKMRSVNVESISYKKSA